METATLPADAYAPNSGPYRAWKSAGPPPPGSGSGGPGAPYWSFARRLSLPPQDYGANNNGNGAGPGPNGFNLNRPNANVTPPAAKRVHH